MLVDINYANNSQRKKELWDVEGILKDRLNQKLKFDLRPLKDNAKIGSFKTKADKMVFDMPKEYIVIDVEELQNYVKTNKIKKVYLQKLIFELDWNIVIKK
jgi:hypothetical protein|tara:strand:- start:2343 stop:2645 length:303 start_codon:yes stop_codon:yes gene_type:complete